MKKSKVFHQAVLRDRLDVSEKKMKQFRNTEYIRNWVAGRAAHSRPELSESEVIRALLLIGIDQVEKSEGRS